MGQEERCPPVGAPPRVRGAMPLPEVLVVRGARRGFWHGDILAQPVGGDPGRARTMLPMPVATPIDATDEQLALVRFDDAGLVPAVVQEEGTGAVLMMAWMNAETLRMSLEEGRTVFWSRSRQEVWRKGDTSGDRQFVRQAFYDCDGDTLLFVVEQEGKGACHTGERSCFYRAFG
jgi:phosphoribosyl-AMP cyclohydrolase